MVEGRKVGGPRRRWAPTRMGGILTCLPLPPWPGNSMGCPPSSLLFYPKNPSWWMVLPGILEKKWEEEERTPRYDSYDITAIFCLLFLVAIRQIFSYLLRRNGFMAQFTAEPDFFFRPSLPGATTLQKSCAKRDFYFAELAPAKFRQTVDKMTTVDSQCPPKTG